MNKRKLRKGKRNRRCPFCTDAGRKDNRGENYGNIFNGLIFTLQE